MTMTVDEIIAKRDSICNSLAFLVEECSDGDDPFFLATAAMLLQISAHLKLADLDYSRRLLDTMITVSRQQFEVKP